MKKIERPSWDAYFMALAKLAASRSTCVSRPAGCVIIRDKQILSTGYIGSMPGVTHCTDEGHCYRRSIGASDSGKYDFCRSIHAEGNAVALAAKTGVSLDGGTAYMTLFPCYSCTKLMIRAGIKEIIYELEYDSKAKERDKHWKEAYKGTDIVVRKFDLNEAEKKFFCNFINKITSERRLESV
jgi:dCMP deaminase